MSIEKERTAIEKIRLHDATFHGEEVQPALINFFYGNNGTGKSTIARVIDPKDTETGQPGDLTWHQGKSADDYSVLVYNQEFVRDNFQGYGNLKGVFTIGEEDIKTRTEIAEKTAQRAEQDKLNGENTTMKEHKEAQRTALLNEFQKDCWAKTKSIRDEFPETQKGYKTPISKFVDQVLQLNNSVQHDIGELRVLYETAFDPNAAIYPEFQPTGETEKLKGSPGNKLLGKAITSSGDSPFADFIKAINATDWVRQGHEHFTETPEGKCPYCQQRMPDDFEEQISSCFDGQYQEDIDSLRQFQEDYASDMQGFLDILNANMQNVFPKLDLTEYRAKIALLEKTIENNKQLISSKIKEPSLTITLENVKALRDEINALIEEFNKQIATNNTIVRKKKDKQTECTTKVWELITFTLQSEVSAYKAKRKTFDDAITALFKLIESGNKDSRILEGEIAELNKNIVSTLPTITSINDLLRDSGFQGFTLREKRGQQNVYEVVRQDGQVAKGLSEGERNFIAFLYFYHLVRGSHTDSDVSRDKIVVIDDPVSSMDSSVLFIVSTLVREMIEICYNNVEYRENFVSGNYIKQIFVLTHNVYFHREVTYNQINRFKWVSIFVVNKTGNVSTIKPCVRQNPLRPTDDENYNPVQNSYTAEWSTYRNVNDVIPLLAAIRRILEYYFMQLCGYEGTNIRKEVLEKNRNSFVKTLDDGSQDLTKFNLASSMLSYINATSVGVNDGLHYVEDNTTIDQYRDVFKMIFEALGQEQHYNHMMSNSEED